MECLDRLTLELAEMTLRPVRALRDAPGPAEATARVLGSGRRYDITVERFPGAARPTYRWRAVEVEAGGAERAGGLRLEERTTRYAHPEAAFWGAVGAISAAARLPPVA